MKQSILPIKTLKQASKDSEAINHQLLTRAGFIEQVASGVYAFMPLGLRVLNKIEDIIRAEMDKVGVELLLPSLSSKRNWQVTERLDTVDVLMKAVPANKAAKDRHQGEYVLNPTHEDIITPIIGKNALSYKDLPVSVYQIQTKFRNEPRAKSGLLRGREFRMKDLYSFHSSLEEHKKFYESIKDNYRDIYNKLGLGSETLITLSGGGDFTKDYSHEFQTLCTVGEDTIYRSKKDPSIVYNNEVFPKDHHKHDYDELTASEVGNIFPLGTKYSQAFGYTFTDQDGSQKPVFMGSYGIGSSRLMGVIVEKFHDQQGIVWPKSIVPFDVHLLALDVPSEKIYQTLSQKYDVLYDDRALSAGQKFAEADLIGIPLRVIISKKTLAKDSVELKKRTEQKTKLIKIANLPKLYSIGSIG